MPRKPTRRDASHQPPSPARAPGLVVRPHWLVMDVHGVLLPSSEKWILHSLAKETHQPMLALYVRWILDLVSAQTGKLPAREFYSRVLGEKLTERQFQTRVMSRYAERGKIPLVIRNQLESLKAKGWKLAILSDMNSAQATFHREHDTFALFDHVFISSETGLMKPFPSVFAALEKRLRTRKDRIVFVDDLFFNTLSAQLQGWRGVTVKGEKQLRHFLKDLQ